MGPIELTLMMIYSVLVGAMLMPQLTALLHTLYRGMKCAAITLTRAVMLAAIRELLKWIGGIGFATLWGFFLLYQPEWLTAITAILTK